MNCLFCKIVSERNSSIIEENKLAMAILDISPLSDGHVLIISKQHFANISEVNEETWNHFLPLIKVIINKLKISLQPKGFNIISNMNEIAYQSIFHLHLHIIPKYIKEKGFIWTSQPQLKYSLEEVIKKLK